MEQTPAPSLHIRSSLVRTMYNKLIEDQDEQQRDHSYWYHVDMSYLPEDLCECYVRFHDDMETREFLEHCYDKSDWVFTQLYHSMAKSLLSWFMSNTSINGFLRRGSMFIFSKSQIQQLLGITAEWKAQKLLDLGAGDGMVTRQLENHFSEVYATEASKPMRWRLKERNYRLLEINEWADGSQLYDVICCLNLLDRCDRPIDILKDIKKSLVPNTGKVIVAVVLPFRPYVEFSNHGDHTPEQNLILSGGSFEEQVASLVTDVFKPLGFIVESFTRLPYLCEGDMEHSFYVLDDAVFVLRVNEHENS